MSNLNVRAIKLAMVEKGVWIEKTWVAVYANGISLYKVVQIAQRNSRVAIYCTASRLSDRKLEVLMNIPHKRKPQSIIMRDALNISTSFEFVLTIIGDQLGFIILPITTT